MNIKAMADNLEIEYPEFMELLVFFVEKSMSDIESLESSVKAGDSMGAVAASHSIKGAAGNLGIMDIYEIAKDIETSGRNNNLDCEESVRALKKALDTFKHTVEQSPAGDY